MAKIEHLDQDLHWLIRAKRLGGHVHVGIWCGTPAQAASKSRPKLGDLTMDLDQWQDFRDMATYGLLFLPEIDEEGMEP